ncbi:MAG: ABC transporter ATP-binding protein [Oscillospiraceae bacterium]|nr:ABC transporter ATP-binding protein [Oscillospiraceae bacterium]
MIKRIYECVREYKTPMFLTLFFITMESVIEVLIPFTTADLVNRIKSGIEMEELLQTGGKLVIMSLLSLACGAIAAYTCSKASTGLARNLRHDIFHKIQTYSFENIDRFSSSSLITRLTTDVNHVQMSFMMLIRTAIRSPLMLLFSIIMSYIMAGPLAATFIVIVPVLAFGLFLVAKNALPSFRRVFKKYDRLNESVEENVRAMRVVKGFSREAYEKVKFHEASDNIRKEFTRAERIVALNTPLMQLCVYFNIVFVLSLGSKLVISSQGTLVDVGQISAMLTYGMQVLMQLMMLSTIAVTLTMSAESVKRINELLTEESSIVSPENGVTEVPDGSIDFENVSFKYFKSAKRDTLSGINLHIKSGMTVGILGNTGVGKSTLVQLIPRLYDTSDTP